MKYMIELAVSRARGAQRFTVEAESKERALEIFKKDGGEFYDEEIEVQELTWPTLADITEFEE